MLTKEVNILEENKSCFKDCFYSFSLVYSPRSVTTPDPYPLNICFSSKTYKSFLGFFPLVFCFCFRFPFRSTTILPHDFLVEIRSHPLGLGSSRGDFTKFPPVPAPRAGLRGTVGRFLISSYLLVHKEVNNKKKTSENC